MRHSPETIKKVIDLRKKGYSILKIMSELSLSKTTVWHHVHKIVLPDEVLKKLRSNQGGSHLRRLENIEKSDILAKKLLGGPFREKLIIIAMLYWAEGHKKNCCEFTNTDPVMIQVFLTILRKVIKIPENRIHVVVRLFEGMNVKECLKYWRKITGIKHKGFKLRMNDGGSSGKTKHGICRISIRKGHQTLKLMHSLIKLISNEILSPLAAVV